jgi:RNA polymerase sigma factor (sigma-70 family)
VIDSEQPQAPSAARQFETTRWSLVLSAGGTTSPDSRDALAQLCELYWYPLYAYVRRQGYDQHQAQDLTQGFFTRLLEKKIMASADSQRGRFRSFLLASLKNFLNNEWDHSQAQKRGGGRHPISLDAQSAESRYANEPAHERSPERLFERRWALTVLDLSLAELREQLSDQGQAVLFDRMKGALAGQTPGEPYRALGEELGMSEAAVKSALHRLRQRLGKIIRGRIAQTVDSPQEIEDELARLLAAMAS